MKLGAYTQQPGERDSYTIDYALDMAAGDAIVSATAQVEPEGLTVDPIFVLDPLVKFWVTDGENGLSYKITITATTRDGRILQDEVVFKIKEI